MKYLGMILFISGLLLVGFALTMDVSLQVDYQYGNPLGLPDQVNNLGLMDERQNYMIFGSIICILGMITVITYEKKSKSNLGLKICPACAEKVKNEALICRFCKTNFVTHESEPEADLLISENIMNTLKHVNRV